MARKQRLQVYLQPAEYAQLKAWSDEAGKSMSDLARDAILEYTDHDRAARHGEKLDAILDAVRTLADDDNTHTQRRNSVPETAREIAQALTSNYGTVIKDTDVVLTIENVADVGDDRSIRKYKSQLRKRGLLFEHPGNSSVWTVNSDEWLEWMADYARLNGKEAAETAVEEYPAMVYLEGDGLRIELETDSRTNGTHATMDNDI